MPPPAEPHGREPMRLDRDVLEINHRGVPTEPEERHEHVVEHAELVGHYFLPFDRPIGAGRRVRRRVRAAGAGGSPSTGSTSQ